MNIKLCIKRLFSGITAAALLGVFPAIADTADVAQFPVRLRLSSLFTEEVGFTDGEPSFFERTAHNFNVPTQQATLKRVSGSSNTVEVSFPNPVQVRLTSYHDGSSLPPLVLQNVKVQMPENQADALFASVSGQSVALSNTDLEQLRRNGENTNSPAPELYALTSVELVVELHASDSQQQVRLETSLNGDFNRLMQRKNGELLVTKNLGYKMNGFRFPYSYVLGSESAQYGLARIAARTESLLERTEIEGRPSPLRRFAVERAGRISVPGATRNLETQIIDAGSRGQRLEILDKRSGSIVLDVPIANLRPISVAHNSRYVAVVFQNGQVNVYMRGIGDLVKTIEGISLDAFQSVDFVGSSLVVDSRMGRWLYSATNLNYLFTQRSSLPAPLTAKTCREIFTIR